MNALEIFDSHPMDSTSGDVTSTQSPPARIEVAHLHSGYTMEIPQGNVGLASVFRGYPHVV